MCLLLSTQLLFGCTNHEQLPISGLTVTIDPSQREELFNTLHSFADKHSFDFTFTDYGTNGQRFLVDLLRKDIKVLAVDRPEAPEMIRIDFYDQSFAYTPSETTINITAELASDLKMFLNEIPNVLITASNTELTSYQRKGLIVLFRLARSGGIEY